MLKFWVFISVFLLYGLPTFSDPVKRQLTLEEKRVPLSSSLWQLPSYSIPPLFFTPSFFESREAARPDLSNARFDTLSQLQNEVRARDASANKMVLSRIEILVRPRLENLIQNIYLSTFKKRPTGLILFEKQIDQVKNISLFSFDSDFDSDSTGHKQLSELRIGFDLNTNSSKLEYREKNLELGIYHKRTLTALTGREDFTENLAFSLNKEWISPSLKATLYLPLKLPYYTAALSHDFSASISSTLSTQAPLKGTSVERKLQLHISIQF